MPEGTYVILKEKGKEDKIGRIFHFHMNHPQKNGVAIVDIHYDMNSSKERLKMHDKFIIGFISKNIFGLNHNKDKFLQIIEYEETENDEWEFIKIEYGSPNVKMFYMYGWRYWNGVIYSNKDLTSNKISCLKKYHKKVNIYKETYSNDKLTNIEYKIPPKVKFVPYEIELIIIYIFFMCVTSIFKSGVALWIILTIIFTNIRNNLRRKYNG